MIKFIHKKHMEAHKGSSKIIIYYNASDIFLGTALLVLVVFFIHDYLSHALTPRSNGGMYIDQIYKNKSTINPSMTP